LFTVFKCPCGKIQVSSARVKWTCYTCGKTGKFTVKGFPAVFTYGEFKTGGEATARCLQIKRGFAQTKEVVRVGSNEE